MNYEFWIMSYECFKRLWFTCPGSWGAEPGR